MRIIRELCDVTVTTGQDAVFEVELSHPGVTTGEWWLGDNLLQNNDLNQMSSQGAVHRLVLKMVTTDESGDVAFVLGEEKCVACLQVEDKPKGKVQESRGGQNGKNVILRFSPCQYHGFHFLQFHYFTSNYFYCLLWSLQIHLELLQAIHSPDSGFTGSLCPMMWQL